MSPVHSEGWSRAGARLALLLLLPLQLTAVVAAAQNDKATSTLRPGQPVERQLAGDRAHSYSIALNAGQYLRAIVEQRGIDVVVTVFGADGKPLLEVDGPNGKDGPEPVSIIAATTGSYRLVVRSLEKTAAAGRYEVRVEALRAATEKDRSLAAAEKLLQAGRQLRSQGTKESLAGAILKFNEALPTFHALGETSSEAQTLFYVGVVNSALGEPRQALGYFNQALPLMRAIGDRNTEAGMLNNIGATYSALGEKQKALDHYAQALPICRAIGNRRCESVALGSIGQVYRDLGDKQKALEYYGQALSHSRAARDRKGEAATLNNIGVVYGDLGEQRKALEYYAQALPVLRAVGDRRGEASMLNNIGFIYGSLGEAQKALEYFNAALPLSRVVGDRGTEAVTLNNIGIIYRNLGENQKALEYFNKALPLNRSIGDRGGEAMSLGNIGVIYRDLGEGPKALEYFNRAVPLQRAVGDRGNEAIVLNNIGLTYKESGENHKALEYLGQAMPILRAVGDRGGEASALNNIGVIYGGMGEKRKALEYYAQALALSRAVANPGGEALTLNNIGQTHKELGETEKALVSLTQALSILRVVGDRSVEAVTLSNMAVLERDRGDLAESRRRIEAALAIVENLRSKYSNQEMRSSYFASVQDYYKFYIDLLMRLHKQQPQGGFDGLALQASEKARARALLDTLAEAGADIRRGVDPKLVERARSLQQQLDARAQEQLKLLSGSHTEAQAAALASQLEKLTGDYQQIEAEIRQTSPHYAALTQPVPLTAQQIQQEVLDPDTLLLEYSLGDERSYLWALTRDTLTSYELPKGTEIEDAARKFYALLVRSGRWPGGGVEAERGLQLGSDAGQSLAAEGTRLSRMLLSPLAARLGKKRLIIVGDGALQYIPFGALPDPAEDGKTTASQPLIVAHEIVTLPSASTVAALRKDVAGRKPAPKVLAVLADPVFAADDRRLRRANRRPAGQKKSDPVNAPNEGLSLSRLPGTRREAEEILKLVPAAERKEALGFEASRETATSPELSKYRYVHFATHGFLDSQHPELSGIALSMYDEKGMPRDGFLRAHQVFNLHLPAEVVVLSACQTGLGKEVKGEGLVGLTRGFMYAGAPRVVVSLWSVNDEATAELMTRFYRGVLVEKLRPAQALQAAQVSLLKEQRYSAPFYWAAFTLQGEWR